MKAAFQRIVLKRFYKKWLKIHKVEDSKETFFHFIELIGFKQTEDNQNELSELYNYVTHKEE